MTSLAFTAGLPGFTTISVTFEPNDSAMDQTVIPSELSFRALFDGVPTALAGPPTWITGTQFDITAEADPPTLVEFQLNTEDPNLRNLNLVTAKAPQVITGT